MNQTKIYKKKRRNIANISDLMDYTNNERHTHKKIKIKLNLFPDHKFNTKHIIVPKKKYCVRPLTIANTMKTTEKKNF